MTNLSEVMGIFSDILTKSRDKEPTLGQLLGVETKPSLPQRAKAYAKKKVDEEGVGWVYPTVGRQAQKVGGKVLDYFVGEMEKSRFEQQPITGNFKPRPDPKNNTTKGEKPVALAKESPRPVPGISEPHPDPKRRGKPKGRKAGGTFESDASVPDDSTYIVGMQKERLGRQISRTKRARKKHQRDMGQKEMAEGSPGRQLKPGERVLPRERPPILEELRVGHEKRKKEDPTYGSVSERSNAMGVLHPQGKDALRRKRRQEIKADSDFEATLGRGWSAPRTKREILMPKRGETREYSTGNHPEWERTKAPRQTPASKTETTPTSTGGRSYRYRDSRETGMRGSNVKVSNRGTDEWNRGETRNWRTRGSQKYKNIDRETLNPNKMEKAYDPYLGVDLNTLSPEKRAEILKPHLAFDAAERKKYAEKQAAKKEAVKYQARKPKQSVMEQRKPAKIEPKDPNKPKEGQWKSGKWVQELANFLKDYSGEYGGSGSDGGMRPSKEYKNPYWKDQARRREERFRQVAAHKKYLKEQAAAKPQTRSQIRDKTKADVKAAGLDFAGMQKSKGNNIYAIATAAAEGDEDKKEEIVRALKRDYKKLLKAFGVPISMPGGRQRILPIAPNSEGGYFTKETWGRHSLHPVARRPKTVTEKERGSHADGGEEYSSGARGGTPAILGMEKAKEYVQRELPFSTEDRDHIAPVPDPHADTLPEPTRRGGSKQGSRRKGEIPKGGWKEAALLWPAQPEDNGKGRKVKTRVGDTTGGYPT